MNQFIGQDKFEKIQKNDKQKQMLCNEKGIELLVIDVSWISYIKEDRIDKVYSQIKPIIEYCYNRYKSAVLDLH